MHTISSLRTSGCACLKSTFKKCLAFCKPLFMARQIDLLCIVISEYVRLFLLAVFNLLFKQRRFLEIDA